MMSSCQHNVSQEAVEPNLAVREGKGQREFAAPSSLWRIQFFHSFVEYKSSIKTESCSIFSVV
tara:strand:+ start:245 stop:433 length:189 start_codon:yes stop_codon:yes gene_type:complete